MDKIFEILKIHGPLTGKELKEKINDDSLKIWRLCNTSEQIVIKNIGKRYLRLDKHIDGYARLSPSILREFFTYTVIGLKEDIENIDLKAKKLHEKINKISKDKFELAKDIVKNLIKSQINYREIEKKAAFIISGDIVYEMAHSELKPESSTGEMIKGSDLDIIIVTKYLSDKIVEELDAAIYGQKFYFMKNPAYREEIDYIIKDISKVKRQLSFDSFEFMIASKILNEGKYLGGSILLFDEIKKMLSDNNIGQKLKILEEIAVLERKKAIEHLLLAEESMSDELYNRLFFTKEESNEIF